MKSLLGLLVAFTSAALLDGSPEGPAASPAPPTLPVVQRLAAGQPVRIVCFGDSITGVYYHTGGRRDWCDLVGLSLRQLYPKASIEMVNAGISGNTTGDALKRIDADVLSRQPQLVIVMFGMNDVARTPAGDFRANLREIVERVRHAGSDVMLMTPNWASPGDVLRPVVKIAEYAQIVRDVGAELHAPVADASRAFLSVNTVDHRAWLGLMSDTIHPNMRGHRLFAEEAVLTLTGQRVVLGDLPPLSPGLPWILEKLPAGQPVRVVAMKPYDTLVEPALLKRFPHAQVEIVPWDANGKALVDLETQAKEKGWPRFNADPALPKPDLVILAVPAEATAANEDQFFHAYTWIINWSLSFKIPGWNAWVILPSVAQPDLDPGQRASEALALEVVRGQDVPYLQRTPGDTTPTAELFERELARLLEVAPPK